MDVYRYGNRSEKIRINTLWIIVIFSLYINYSYSVQVLHDYLKTIFIDLFKMIICIINGANIIKVGFSVHGEMRFLK